jgi:DNA polymerase-3 subunit epsilon
MNIGLFGDTETTGMIEYKRQSSNPCQPHIVSLAAILVNLDTKEELQSINVIVKPDGWTIPDETIEVHGITNELANEVGLPESVVLGMYINLWQKCSLRIFHNTTFDNRIIRIALKRYMPNLIPDEVWKDRDQYYCTFQKFKKLIGGKDGHKLEDAYKHFTGKELVGGHNALVDTQACMEVYWGLQEPVIPF